MRGSLHPLCVRPHISSPNQVSQSTMSNLATTVPTATQANAQTLALEAYIYLYPLMLMETTRKQMTNVKAGVTIGRGPANQFSHVRAYPPADFKDVVRPNFDTLYSSAWLDLGKGPVLVTVPDTNGRYYLLPMLDMWTDVFAVPGWRTSGTQAQKIAVIPPGWQGKLPVGIKAVHSTTDIVWIIGRTKTDGPDDYAAVHTIQDGLQITNLDGSAIDTSSYSVDASIDMKTPPMVQVDKMTGAEYFAAAAELLKKYAPHQTDWSQIARLNQLGISVGESFDIGNVSSEIKNAIAATPQIAQKLLIEKISQVGRSVNGWQMTTSSIGVYGNDYLQRAVVALVGLGANQPQDAIYPLNTADKDGNPLNGDNNYVLKFAADQIPPADAFWSLTMYDMQGFACANSINRFAVTSWMPLVKNTDGSLEIYIQNENPGESKQANWLPAPKGPMNVTMRLYAPRAEALNGDWVPPDISKR